MQTEMPSLPDQKPTPGMQLLLLLAVTDISVEQAVHVPAKDE